MKTNLLLLATFILIILAAASCKKDSKNDTTRNFLKVDGTEYDMSKGFILNNGNKNSVSNMGLVLISSGITAHLVNGIPDSASGTGNVISIELLTSGSDKLTPGDYQYSDSELAGSFYYGSYALNWNSPVSYSPDYMEFNSGTVKVINSGAVYELSFTGKDANNKDISDYYKGSQGYYTDFKKSANPAHKRN